MKNNSTNEEILEEKLTEKLAELEHIQWMQWAKALVSENIVNEETKQRWSKLFIPYAELSEDMKNLDRDYARKIVNTIKKFLKETE